VPALGVTYTLQYEPVQAVAEALDDLEEETGLDIRGNSWAFRASERHVSAETYCRQSDPRGVELAEQRRRPKSVRRSGHRHKKLQTSPGPPGRCLNCQSLPR
jgi:hypothetical protein